MKKYIFKLFLLSTTFFFTSCFEVIEEISLNDDGSGNISMTINLSRSKTKVSSIMLMDSINGYKVPKQAEIRQQIKKIVSELKQINGVSNVHYTTDFTDYIFNISCDFSSVDVLNKVVHHFSAKSKGNNVTNVRQFRYNKNTKTFVRTYSYDLAREIKKVSPKDRDVLQNATVTTIYRFQSPITGSKNPKARISKNRKAIMLRVNVAEMINKKTNIKNTIQLKK